MTGLTVPGHIIVRQSSLSGRRAWSVQDADELLGDDITACRDMSAARREQYLKSRSLIRDIVVNELGDAWHGFQHKGQTGPPRLRDSSRSVSITHCGAHVAVAVASGVEVGIDIERTDAVFDSPSLQRRMCTPGELARAASMRPLERRRWLTRLWTVKEAYVKSRGRGLSLDLRAVDSADLPAHRRSAWVSTESVCADVALTVVWAEGGSRP